MFSLSRTQNKLRKGAEMFYLTALKGKGRKGKCRMGKLDKEDEEGREEAGYEEWHGASRIHNQEPKTG